MEMPSTVAVGNTPSLSQTLTKPNAECTSLIDKADVSDLSSIKKEDTDEEVDVQNCSNNQLVLYESHLLIGIFPSASPM